MAGEITALAAATSWESGDLIEFVDIDDPAMDITGTNKRITLDNFFLNMPLSILSIRPASGSATIQAGLSGTDHSSFVDLGGALDITKKASSGNAFIDAQPLADDGAGNASVRLFRETDTTGDRVLQQLRGDNSATVDHQHKSGTSGLLVELCRNGGSVRIGTGGSVNSGGYFRFPINDDANRPSAVTAGQGASFFNSDDGELNISDGTNWLLMSTGATT